MLTLPRAHCSLLVRTDFTSEDAWQAVRDEALREYEDGFRANLEPVSDPAFDGAGWQMVRAAVPPDDHGPSVLFIADRSTLASPDHPVLAVDLLEDPGHRPFRCIPPELRAVENNLNIANMSWEDFADEIDDSGVYRACAHSRPLGAVKCVALAAGVCLSDGYGRI
jgi:hypothetical protein